jgi:hypothetical protein
MIVKNSHLRRPLALVPSYIMILFLGPDPFHHLYLHDLCLLSHHGHLFVHPGPYSYSADLVADL